MPWYRESAVLPGLQEILANPAKYFGRAFYSGLWRARVVDDKDPLRLGRVRVAVPNVHPNPDVTEKDAFPWAAYCAVDGGSENAGDIVVPEVGDDVFVAFEEGDIAFPIRVGAPFRKHTSRTAKSIPPEANAVGAYPRKRVTRTRVGHAFVMSDAPKDHEMALQTAGGRRIVIRDDVRFTRRNGDETTRRGLLIETANGSILLNDEEGELAIEWDGDVQANVTGNVVANVGGDMEAFVTQDVLIDSGGTIDFECTDDETHFVGRDLDTSVSGSAIYDVTNDEEHTIGRRLNITAGVQVNITAPSINLNGAVSVNGSLAVTSGSSGTGDIQVDRNVIANGDISGSNVSVSGAISDALGNLTTHTHLGVKSGTDTTGTRTP
jgi:hypothetical protein